MPRTILHERLRELVAAGEDAAVVLDDGVVMGLLDAAGADGAGDAPAAAVMEPGPSTIRADVPLPKLRTRMRRRGLDVQVVTDPDGRLIGLVRA